jgi:hypothetical protein
MTWHPMLVISCHSSFNVGHNMSLVTWTPLLVADYDQRQALSHNWQTMINVKNQSTSGRLWPTSDVKSLVTDYEKQCASGHEWQIMTNIVDVNPVVGQSVTRHLTLNVGHSLSLVTWQWQIVTNIVCQVTNARLWPTLGIMSRVTDYYQHRASSHEWQTMTDIECQVTSDSLWPISGFKSRVTYHDQQRVSSHEWHTMTNMVYLTHAIGHILSLKTWHPMLVIVYHSWIDTRCCHIV